MRTHPAGVAARDFVPGGAEEIRRLRGEGGLSAGRGAAAVGIEEMRGPHSGRYRVPGLRALDPELVRAGRAQFPMVGPGGGSDSPGGTGSAVHWDSVRESILPGG